MTPMERGFSCATMEITVNYENVNWIEFMKNFRVWILFSATREDEREITSNRELVRYGEFGPRFCTHRLSRCESLVDLR